MSSTANIGGQSSLIEPNPQTGVIISGISNA
jgi:hypothetical protein